MALPAGAAADPVALAQHQLDWISAQVPGTAAGALRAAGRWALDSSHDFDAEDGWWHCEFERPASSEAEYCLRFDGLAALAEVWLNGHKILDSDNQFLAHEINITAQLKSSNSLHLRCASLNAALKAKRPRPRWRTRLVAQQQLRWHRSTLLGRIPGWSPPVAATGPWRGVTLIQREQVEVLSADFKISLEGSVGIVTTKLHLRADKAIRAATLQVGEQIQSMQLTAGDAATLLLTASLRVADAQAWWPHTHGTQPLYALRIKLDCAGDAVTLDCGRTGFRSIVLDTSNEGFALQINGVEVFCRGACWTTLDIATLDGDEVQLTRTLDQFRDAGFNLLRIGGTMVYESSRFYEACAERGIMVWQDYCFANMDYPGEDAHFTASVREEAIQFLARTQLNPALCLLCGNSEIEQQVSMLGQPQQLWRAPLFAEVLPALSLAARPDVPYVPSSPSGGVLPFHVDAGLSHYYGVGAYQRPLDDARRAGVRFTSECLAFANVPEPEMLELFLRDGEIPPHHPRWKARVPRDSGPGWDFDDVRDHYLARLFSVDPARLRYVDVERYLYLSRLVTAEVMTATMSEWRRNDSPCKGALVWFWRDLWPGAGWGLVDASGLPKAPYFALKRICVPVALLLTDEGLNGLALHAVNDSADELPVRLQLALYRRGEILVASGETAVTLPARAGITRRGDALIGHFTDMTQAYRFGPSGHDVAIARLLHAQTGEILGQSFHIPDVQALAVIGDAGLSGTATLLNDGRYEVRIQTQKFAHGVWLDARGYEASDNYFHLAPGSTHTVMLRPRTVKSRLQAFLHTTTGSAAVRVAVGTTT